LEEKIDFKAIEYTNIIYGIFAIFALQLSYTPYSSVSQTFFKWGPLSLVRMFYGPPYSWDYKTH